MIVFPRIGLTGTAVLIGMIVCQPLWFFLAARPRSVVASKLPAHVGFIEADWHISVVQELPERITVLKAHATDDDVMELFVGTGPSGSIYRVRPDSAATPRVMAVGLGDRIRFGTCEVSALAIHDLDRDGIPELLAETSQILPIGRPRLYAWSLEVEPELRAMARPDIRSSWSHTLAFLPGGDADSVISTYCGYGEVVQFQLLAGTTNAGFQSTTLGWQQVAQLPASGEQAITGDVDNDGVIDVSLCAGFAPLRAAIHIYSADEFESGSEPRYVIDEGCRFGNVRAVVTQLTRGGPQELLAWWCTERDSGECEIIRYQLHGGDVCTRTVLMRGAAAELWPTDTQLAIADADQDGASEVWFMAGSGDVHRYVSEQEPALQRICKVAGLPGAIASVATHSSERANVYVTTDRFLLRLRSASSAD